MKSIEEKLKITVDAIYKTLRGIAGHPEWAGRAFYNGLKIAHDKIEKGGDMPDPNEFAGGVYDERVPEHSDTKGGGANATDEFPKPLNPLHKDGRDRGVDWNRIRSIAETSGHPLIETALLQLKARVDEIASEIDRHRRLAVQANDMLKKRLDNQAKPIMPEMLEACDGPAMGTSRPPKGAVPMEFDEKCNLCSGSGQIPTSKQGDSSVCPQCGGEGVIGIDMTEDNPLRPCPDCKSESPEAEPPRCTRHPLQKLSDCPIHGKTASKPDNPPESDEPRSGELVWWMDGEHRWRAIQCREHSLYPGRSVRQDECRELRIAKDALKNIRLCLLTTELSRKHLAGSLEKTLIGMGDKVTIERKEQDDE